MLRSLIGRVSVALNLFLPFCITCFTLFSITHFDAWYGMWLVLPREKKYIYSWEVEGFLYLAPCVRVRPCVVGCRTEEKLSRRRWVFWVCFFFLHLTVYVVLPAAPPVSVEKLVLLRPGAALPTIRNAPSQRAFSFVHTKRYTVETCPGSPEGVRGGSIIQEERHVLSNKARCARGLCVGSRS